MKYIIMMLLLVCNVASAQGKTEGAQNNGAQEKPKLQFLPGYPKSTIARTKKHLTFRAGIREFKVGKKYCLWGAKDWDDKCQDAAMEYAYGENWREFKKVALDFVEYVNKMEREKLLTLFSWEYDGIYPTLAVMPPVGGVSSDYTPGIGSCYPNIQQQITLIDWLEYLQIPVIKNWQKALKGAKYKDFFVAHDQTN
jgi:hypothetical protein